MPKKSGKTEKLPPLCQVSGSTAEKLPEGHRAKLMKGLRELQGPHMREKPSMQKSFLEPIMPSSRRANQGIEEVECELAMWENSHVDQSRRKLGGVCFEDPANQLQPNGIAAVEASFKSLVDEIEDALNGGEHATRILRRGDQITEHIPSRGVRYYRIPLPSRPTEVTVVATRKSGSIPSGWASTSIDEPCSSHYDIKGQREGNDVKVVYRHMIHPMNSDEDLNIDRRRAVPPCRDLFVTIEGEMGECQISMVAMFTQINVVLTRHELAAQLAKMKRTWATRVHEYQHQPVARAEFEADLAKQVEINKEKKRKFARNLNFVHSNIADACDKNAVNRKVTDHYKRILKNIERRERVASNRLKMSGETTRSREPEWVEDEPTRHLQGCEPVLVANKHAAVEQEQVPALPPT